MPWLHPVRAAWCWAFFPLWEESSFSDALSTLLLLLSLVLLVLVVLLVATS